MNPGKRKIPLDMAVIMTTIAAFFDVLNILAELIPFVGFFIGFVLDLVMAAVFYVWFAHYDIKLFSERNAGASMIALVFNALPITDLTFPWTIRVGSLAFSAR